MRGIDLNLLTALDVLLQEIRLEVGEDLVPVKSVVGGRETAAGDGGNRIEFVEQPPVAAIDRDVEIPQPLQDAVGERRRALAADHGARVRCQRQ